MTVAIILNEINKNDLVMRKLPKVMLRSDTVLSPDKIVDWYPKKGYPNGVKIKLIGYLIGGAWTARIVSTNKKVVALDKDFR